MTLAESVIQAPFTPPIHGFCTTRYGGVGRPPFDSFNLGSACGDDPVDVAKNRDRLQRLLPGSPRWLRQVHGSRVIHLDDWTPGIEADAAWTDRPGQVACVLRPIACRFWWQTGTRPPVSPRYTPAGGGLLRA